MEIGATLYVKDREEWRAWLEENHASEKEIWLIFPKKGSSRPRIHYDHAVEEALCFGWIDSIVKAVNEEHYVQKFSVRKPRSNWSDLNRRRVRELVQQGRMTPAGLGKVTFELEESD